MKSRIKASHPHAVIEGMLVCQQAKEGVELIVGAMEDPMFGPTLMVGMGGIFAEIMKDTALGKNQQLIPGMKSHGVLPARPPHCRYKPPADSAYHRTSDQWPLG